MARLQKDVNRPDVRYEGRSSFALYSPQDMVIRTECCGHQCGELKNANRSTSVPNHGHGALELSTLDTQFQLLGYSAN